MDAPESQAAFPPFYKFVHFALASFCESYLQIGEYNGLFFIQ